MSAGMFPPSSPIPHPSVPPRPLTSTSNTPDRRTLIRAGSSSRTLGLPTYGVSGHVTASGLSTWRRGKRSQRSGSGCSDEDTLKKGPGMGMEGTPARRKKARSTIGRVSLPSSISAVKRSVLLIRRVSDSSLLQKRLPFKLPAKRPQ